MSDLSRSLVDAAAVELVAVTPDNEHADKGARAAVAAVLETLAAYMGPRFNTIGVADIRHLAAEVKEGR